MASSQSYVVEMELMAISAAKAVKSIMEELGTSCGGGINGDDEVHGGEEPHETIDDVRDVLRLGDSLSRTPWGGNAKDNRGYYIVDTGHEVTVKPATTESPSADSAVQESVKRVERFLKDWMVENDWKARQAEVSQRLDRHGEVFDLLHYDDDGILRTYFAEPYDLEDDPASPYQDSEELDVLYIDRLGIRRTNDIQYKPVMYYIDGSWYPDLQFNSRMGALPRAPRRLTFVQHRKRNVFKNTPRGLTLYWPVREELIFAKKLLANMMRVSGFQAAFGAIRTISEMHSADAVKSYLSSLQGGGGSSGEKENFDFPAASVVTVPSTVKYDFPETGVGQSNHIEVLVQLLRACASGMRLPEFMLTANVSEGNFASTLVSEGPFHKGMRFEQERMVEEDKRILMQALRWAATVGEADLTMEDVDVVTLHIKPPRVQTRNRKEDFEVNQKLWEDSLLSGKDFLASEGYEYDSQHKQIEAERKEQVPSPGIKPADQTGPVPGIKADQMNEPGVSAGEPSEIPED